MRTIAFVGPSGTGKSYRALTVAKDNGADAFIDDGLLIAGTKVLAGISAKRESTKIASVRRALFTSAEHARMVKKAIRENHIQCLMILGTSDGMVNKIAAMLDVPAIEKIIRIEDIATPEEMEIARESRLNDGNHVIPAPTFEIKKDFSGYFLHPSRLFQRNMDKAEDVYNEEKSIVRPTFSYRGNYEISDNVIAMMAAFEAERTQGIYKVNSVNIRKTDHGVHMDMAVTACFGYDLCRVCRKVQYIVQKNIETYTSVNVRRVHIYVRGINKND